MEWTELIELAAAAFGTLGFAIVFNVRGKMLFFATLGGLFSWTLFLFLGFLFENEVLRYFIVSMLTSVYGEVMARTLKTPTTVFSVVCLVPLVPGSGLYYTMTNAFAGNMDAFVGKATGTLYLAAALSFGVVIVNTSAVYIKKHLWHRSTKKAPLGASEK